MCSSHSAASSFMNIQLSSEQEAVLLSIASGNNVLVTGSAGTGKSTILRELSRRYGGSLAITASTGIAAVNVGGMTIHSWAGLGLGEMSAEELAEQIYSRRGKVYRRIVSTERLAIDEISMIHGDLFQKIEQVFRVIRENHRPFGGMQLILFGDFLQLPPVSKQEECKFAFQSNAWASADIRVHCLKQVFRQQDQAFAAALNEIRLGNLSEDVRRMLRDRLNAEDPNPDVKAVTIYTHNTDVDATNLAELQKLPGPEKQYAAADTGEPSALKTLQKNCLAPEILRLKTGAQVMLLQNIDPIAGLANGSIGTVIAFDSLYGHPVVRFQNETVLTMDYHHWSLKNGDEILAERRQFPLRLAWAISAHKSQGMTLDKVAVHLDRAFECGQSYVALSRAKSLAGLFIRSSKIGCIRAHPEAVKFYSQQ